MDCLSSLVNLTQLELSSKGPTGQISGRWQQPDVQHRTTAHHCEGHLV